MATKAMFSISAIGGLIVVFSALFGGVQVADTRYVASSEFNAMSVEVYYAQFYDTIDRLARVDKTTDPIYHNELTRRLERLKAKICKIEPDWSRCDDPE